MSDHCEHRALTRQQERRLVEFLDEEFMKMTRGYKKRSEATTHLPTLQRYLEAATKLLSVILQIPPVDPSTSLRTAYLLHLTNDVLCSVIGYEATPQNVVDLLDWIDDLDQAWLSVLHCQVWDPRERVGTDLVVDADDALNGVKTVTTPLSQTEKTRLRSLLLGGIETFEEWVYGLNEQDDERSALETMGLRQAFDLVFSRTLDELKGLGGLNLQPISLREDDCIMELDA